MLRSLFRVEKPTAVDQTTQNRKIEAMKHSLSLPYLGSRPNPSPGMMAADQIQSARPASMQGSKVENPVERALVEVGIPSLRLLNPPPMTEAQARAIAEVMVGARQVIQEVLGVPIDVGFYLPLVGKKGSSVPHTPQGTEANVVQAAPRCMSCDRPAEIRVKDRGLQGVRVRRLCSIHAQKAWQEAVQLYWSDGTAWRVEKDIELEAL